MTYRNPVLPGFYPDPSICRVNEDYYLVTSTFEYFPGVPIFHSRDLIHWNQLGHCLSRPEQLPLAKARCSRGIYAPTLRYHDGRFFMITTNRDHGGNFFVHAAKPEGPWSDPVWVDMPRIDPSLFFDDDGKVYLSGSGILQVELDIRTGKLLGEPRQIWSGTGGKCPEGPHLYKIDGLYYLLIAEGGTEYGHMVSMARSESPWGPWEACPHNPLLSHRSLQSPVQATGHADLVQDHLGQWWLVCLGIRPQGHYPPVFHLGRETFLAPVHWEQGWPVIGNHGRLDLTMTAETLPLRGTPASPEKEPFNSPELPLHWNWLRNPRPEDWSLTERPGWLRLKGSPVSPDDEASPAWIGRRQQHFTCRVSAELDFEPAAENEEAGLCILMNNRHHYEIGVSLRQGRRCIFVRRRIGSLSAETACRPLPAGPVVLAIQAETEQYTFSVHQQDGSRLSLATGETRYLSTDVAGGFTGVYLAMYATGNGQPCRSPADFHWFEYKLD